MEHCASCTCRTGVGLYHTRCPRCGYLTANKLLAQRPGVCESCREALRLTHKHVSVNVYLCALCYDRGTLLHLKPSTWYACKKCVKIYGSKDAALLEIIERLKVRAAQNDPQLNNLQLVEQMHSLSTALQKQKRKETPCQLLKRE